jgi:hypothetical protein
MCYQLVQVQFTPATPNKDSQFVATGPHGRRVYPSSLFTEGSNFFMEVAKEYAREFEEDVVGLELQPRDNPQFFVLTHKP